jgi:hypothetical protein
MADVVESEVVEYEGVPLVRTGRWERRRRKEGIEVSSYVCVHSFRILRGRRNRETVEK